MSVIAASSSVRWWRVQSAVRVPAISGDSAHVARRVAADDHRGRRSDMRILLAVDGSEPADRAAALIASVPPVEDARLWIVGVAPSRGEVFGSAWGAPLPPDPDDIERPVIDAFHAAVERAAGEIRDTRSDVAIETIVVRGRPASVIVERARELEVDLIVVGHRGRGTWSSRLLGSVSAEVVDHAPCPVLVARDDQLGPVVLAVDGSPDAAAATELVASWPLFRGLPVRVVGVVEDAFPYAPAVAPLLYEETVTRYTEAVEAERGVRSVACAAAADRLRIAGLDATMEIRSGDPAHEIVATAGSTGAGVVVVGTRGLTGLRRLVLGSVARNVLLSAPCSVLIVREPPGRGAATRSGSTSARDREVVSAFG
jgi:nucleotide-binding universal stress UspA family protein